MRSLWKALSSSIGQKVVIAITGLGLIGFLITHLAGNLLLYLGFEHYNAYAKTLHANPLLPIAEVGLLLLFILHIALAIKVSNDNRQARGHAYVVKKSKQGKSSITASSIMLFSGVIVLGFILLHLADMRFHLRHHFEDTVSPAALTFSVLLDPVSSIVYLFGSLFLAYHLWHAFQSVFQTLGLNGPRFTPLVKKIGVILALILGLGFASFPIWAYLKNTGVL